MIGADAVLEIDTWYRPDDVLREAEFIAVNRPGSDLSALADVIGVERASRVKTMDVPWIWDFKKGRTYKSWSGHVFLEIYLDDQWVLLDPGAKLFYDDYSPA